MMKKILLTFVLSLSMVGISFGGFGPYSLVSVGNDVFVGWFTNTFPKTSQYDQQGMALQFLTELEYLVSNQKISKEKVSKLDKMFAEKMNQPWWDMMLSYPECRYSYRTGLIVTEQMSIPTVKEMYVKALKKSGRTAAIKLYEKYGVRPSLTQMTEEFADLEFAVEYMNTELYYDINTVASQVSARMFRLKHDQLIEAGYPVWKKTTGNGRIDGYSDGAKELLRFTEAVIKSFNEPYFFGLNSKLQEIGVKARFNPIFVVSANDALGMAHDFILNKTVISLKSRWNLRIALGVSGFNELIDRKINGDKILMQKTGNNPANVRQ